MPVVTVSGNLRVIASIVEFVGCGEGAIDHQGCVIGTMDGLASPDCFRFSNGPEGLDEIICDECQISAQDYDI
jgi:hypothetical protein